jgi:hypothetical protein
LVFTGLKGGDGGIHSAADDLMLDFWRAVFQVGRKEDVDRLDQMD